MNGYSEKTINRRKEMVATAKKVDIYEACREYVDFKKDGSGWLVNDGGQYLHYRVKGSSYVYLPNGRSGRVYDPINFVEEFMNLSFNDAVEFLTKGMSFDGDFKPQPKKPKVVKEPLTKERLEKMVDAYEFPEVDMVKDKGKVAWYLKNTRAIDKDIVDWLLQKRLVRQDSKNNAVFVWYDHRGEIAGCDRNGTYIGKSGKRFKGVHQPSVRDLGFKLKNGEPTKMYVFESAIDLISYYCLNRGKDKLKNALFVAMGGNRNDFIIDNYQLLYPNCKEIIICVDNDEGGEEMVQAIDGKHEFVRETPRNKDWNEDLIESKKQTERVG